MNNKTFIYLIFCLVLIIPGCSKDNAVSQELTQSTQHSIQSGDESALITVGEGTPIKGNSSYAEPGECDAASQGATYALRLTGNLKGCIYAFVDVSECSGDGYYWEEGREHFIGMYNGESGEFWTTYRFLGRYEGCSEGAPTGAEIMGFCDHPLVKDSGTGVFEGVTGRYVMIDNVKKGEFPYEGHLKF